MMTMVLIWVLMIMKRHALGEGGKGGVYYGCCESNDNENILGNEVLMTH